MNLFISITMIILFVSILTFLFFLRDYILNWCRKNKKKLLGIGFTITVVSAGTGYVLMNLGNEVPPIVDNAAFIWHSGTGYGGIPHWEINKTFAKQFLKDNMKWRLQASPNNETWYDANELLKIDLNWNDIDCSYKVTLTLNTTNAPQSLYYRFDLACNKSLKQFFETNGYEWTLTIPANNTIDYVLRFNWSDIQPLIQNGKIWYDKGVTNNFFWFRIQSVNKIAVDKVFVVDPVYGVMPANAHMYYEYDAANGIYPDLFRLGTSEYYLVAARMTMGGTAGLWVATIKVWNDNGTIQKSIVDSLRIAAGYYPSLCHVYDDVYAVAFTNSTSVGTIRVYTFTANDADGDIGAATIDSLVLTKGIRGIYCDMVKLSSNNMFVVSYCNITYSKGWLETIYIDNSGNIPAASNGSLSFNSTYAKFSNMVTIDSNSIALVYEGSGTDAYICTYNVTALTGDIQNTKSDEWEFNNVRGEYPNINLVSGNVYCIAYADNNIDMSVNTLTITTNGVITKSFIDTLVMGADTTYFPTVIPINDGQVYAVTYRDASNDGQLKTFNMTSAGVIDASYCDTLEFANNDSKWWAPIIWVNQSMYLIVFTGTGDDGWSCAVNITTNWASPVFTNPSPANESIDQTATPLCAISVNDTNNDTMSITFAENSTGVWVNRQTNSSVLNGTYRWTFAQASTETTKYWWKVYANDTFHNVSAVYDFTTHSSPIPTNLTLEGLTTDWNVTWNGSIPSGSGNVNVTFCNSSGIEFETVELNIVVNDTMWVDNIYFWAGWLNDTTNNTQIYTDNITVWVSDDNLTWGVLQHNIGNGMGRFPHTMGYLHWNWTTEPLGVTAFSYIPTKGYVIDSNTTLYVRYQLNITDTANTGLHRNLSGSPWEICIVNESAGAGIGIIDSESFTCQAEVEPLPWINTAPVQSNPIPANNSYDNEKPIVLTITVNDIDDVVQDMDIIWQTNHSGSWVTFASNLSVNNGTYRQPMENLTIPGTKYWWRVILDDNAGGWDNHTYHFTIDNDTVWYKSSSYYAYLEIDDLSFDPIVVSDSYVMFNTTDFKVTCDNRTNITILFINTSITGASPGDLLIDFCAHNKGGLVWFNISGFDPTANYTVNCSNTWLGNYTADITGDISFSDTLNGAAPRYQIYLHAVASVDVYTATVRTNNYDYFVWLGDNTTAYWVYYNITGLNEATEYVALYNNSGIWGKFYGDKTGWNFTVHTFDVIRTYMDDAINNVSFNMLGNPDIDYDIGRTVSLKCVANKYNYTGYTNTSVDTSLSAINTTLNLPTGYWCALWNRTTFTFNYWISGFSTVNYAVTHYDVIATRINANKNWDM